MNKTSAAPVGLDIGYSSVKLAFGHDHPQRMTFPVGACPANEYDVIHVGGSSHSGREVLVNGRPWLANLDSTDRTAPLDESYPETDEYQALYLAALDATNLNEIGLLVIGLPVNQYLDEPYRKRLAMRLSGRKYIRAGRTVDVANVSVVPQPMGAYVSARASAPPDKRAALGPSSVVLVCDPGHFSFDAIVWGNGIRAEASFSTMTAGEVVLRRASEVLSGELGRTVPVARLQRAVRDNRSVVSIGTSEIPFLPAIERAAAEVVGENLRKLRGQVRSILHRDGLDAIVVAGGGANWFLPAIREAFPDTDMIVSPEPVLANVLGFWSIANAHLGKSRE